MRRKFYLSFAIALIISFGILILWHAPLFVFVSILFVLALIAIIDLLQKPSNIRRNFPILGNTRYMLEFIRPEIQQYFIASDISERPFDRETRTLIYQRSRKQLETLPFGTHRDLHSDGMQWAQHSLHPANPKDVKLRTRIGLPSCKQPYNASLLNISAMSFGALSHNAIQALNLGAKEGGFAHNTGEGGISSHHLQGGDLIFQIGTAYFGVRTKDGSFDESLFKEKSRHPSIKMIEVKLSQGAKPSHGGILPAAKLSPEIAAIRHVELGKDVLSPAVHTAFSNPIEMMQFIEKLRDLSDGKPVGFKLCVGRYSEFYAICKAIILTGIKPDFITIDGAEGGTGAAPIEFCNNLGIPLEEALNFVHNSLVGANIRDDIKLIASGKIATGFDMITKFALGADLCNAARAFMLSLGCVQSLQCHTNNCPTGVATTSKRLSHGVSVNDKFINVKNFHEATIRSCADMLAAMGFNDVKQLKPIYIQRRVSQEQIKTNQEIFQQLEPGILLTKDIPEELKANWESASADTFKSQ